MVQTGSATPGVTRRRVGQSPDFPAETERGGRDLKGVTFGEPEGSSRPSRPKAVRWDRKGRENALVENHETQSGTHVPELVARLARMDPAELARLLHEVARHDR